MLQRQTLVSCNNLAIALRLQGELLEAERLYRRALDGFHTHLGKLHHTSVRTARNLAVLLQEQGYHIRAVASLGVRWCYGS